MKGKGIVKRAALVEMNGHEMTTDGRFHANLLADYTIKKSVSPSARVKWITLREAALTMYRSGSVSHQENIRKRLGKLADELKQRGHTLVVDPTTKAFKLYEGAEIEKQHVLNKQGYWEARAAKAGEWSEYLNETVKAPQEGV